MARRDAGSQVRDPLHVESDVRSQRNSLAVVPPGPSGYCTKKCSPSGSTCPGAPSGMFAKCLWQSGPTSYICVFLCKDGPTTYSCSPKHTCAGNNWCKPI